LIRAEQVWTRSDVPRNLLARAVRASVKFMERFLALIVVQMIAAGIGIFSLVAVVLDNLMRSLRDETQIALSVSLLAIAVLTLVSFRLAARGRERRATMV
jgi:hypothetical protein